jgi:hypothetical protein
MKQGIFVLCFCLISSSLFASRTLNRVSSFQVRADGKFDIICQNGNFETATQEDFQNNAVCGAPAKPFAGSIKSGFFANNRFTVLCSNGKVETHSAYSVQEGLPCVFANKTVGAPPFANAAQLYSANKLRFVSFEVTTPTTVVALGLNSRTSGVDPQTVIGLYSADSSGNPENLIVSSDVLDVEDDRVYTSKISEKTLAAGKYFLGVLSNGEITLSSTSKASEMLSTDIPYNDKLPAKITTTVTKATVNFMPAIFAIVK